MFSIANEILLKLIDMEYIFYNYKKSLEMIEGIFHINCFN